MEYLVNKKGERTRVVLSVEEYERLVELAENALALAEADDALAALDRGEEELIPWEESKRRRAREHREA